MLTEREQQMKRLFEREARTSTAQKIFDESLSTIQLLREERENLQMLLNNELSHAVTMAKQNEMLMEDLHSARLLEVAEDNLAQKCRSEWDEN